MQQYLDQQAQLMLTLQRVCRYAGILAGLMAMATPFALFSRSSSFVGYGTDSQIAASIATAMLLGFPAGMNLMFLAISLKGRKRDLGRLEASLGDKEGFNSMLDRYMAKLNAHSIVLIIVGAMALLSTFYGAFPQSGFQNGEGLAPGLVCLAVSVTHFYLGWALMNQRNGLAERKIA